MPRPRNVPRTAALRPARRPGGLSRALLARLPAGSGRVAAALAGWSVLLAGVAYGLHRLEPAALRSAGEAHVRIEWMTLPPWLEAQGPALLAEIESYAGLSPQEDVVDPGLVQRVHRGLSSCAWIAAVQRVTKEPSGALRVWAGFRMPLGWVAFQGNAFLVDEHGVRLPHSRPLDAVNRAEWFVLTGAAHAPPQVGQAWAGRDVAAGLRLVRFLFDATFAGEVPFRGYLRSVDVSNFERRTRPFDGKLRLLTIHPASYIDWGEPPGEEYTVEATPHEKLMHVRDIYQRHGQLPDGVAMVVRWRGRYDLRPVEPPPAELTPAQPPRDRRRGGGVERG